MENEKGRKPLLRNRNCQESIFVALCSVALLVYAMYHHYFDKNAVGWSMSPYLFPTLLSVFGLLLSLSLMMDAVNEVRGTSAVREEDGGGKRDLTSVAVVVAVSLAYYALMPVLTFIPATLLYLAGLFLYLGERKWWKLALLSIITTGAIYVLFGVALNVRLP